MVVEVGANISEIAVGDRVVIDTMAFTDGPIGLGAVLGYRSKGGSSIVVVDVLQTRLDKALGIGADAVINSADKVVVLFD
ncbi:hypothetical protein V5R04_12560 [Jonesiaceae bacterium BS-20]|uniref:Uncharacterized protein n=1 Tax=Jonesiaceae bacterium BS-20 TaxID=3120821 RepID=A0AAU7DTC1_9MICO